MTDPSCSPPGPARSVRRCLRPGVVLVMLGLLAPGRAHAAAGAQAAGFAACRTAIRAAALAAGLPWGLLASVAAVESGRPAAAGAGRAPVRSIGLRIPPRLAPPAGWEPWPWTINADGVGQFFATKAQAIAAVVALQAAGVRSIDVGCLQVNLQYHPHAFRSLADAFDPRANARYAAGFLNRLFGRLGDWPKAVAAYHSQTPALGHRYRRRVYARWRAGGGGIPASHAYADFQPRREKYADFDGR